MILVDTSIWIDHFRGGHSGLIALLDAGEVLTHPFVIGELACGSLKRRREVLTLLAALPRAEVAHDSEVLLLIEALRLHGRGIGWVDAHLVAAARLSRALILTTDRPLARVAESLRLAAS